jgi:hypothetical protein
MSRIIRSTKFWLLAAVAAASLAGTAYATIPGGDGVIHGCYAKSGGTLRVIDASVTNCKSGETALNWSQQGQPGPQGEPGPPGPQGEPGAPGFSSVFEARGVDTVLTGTSIPDANTVATIADLEPGTYVLHGKLDANAEPGTTESRVVCRIAVGEAAGVPRDFTNAAIGQAGQALAVAKEQSLKMQLVAQTDASSSATLRCHTENLVGNAPRVTQSSLIAIRVGTAGS